MFANKKRLKKFRFESYEPCPCESGKKYKFCCYVKAKQNKPKSADYNHKRLSAEAFKAIKNTDFKTCFGFDKSECKNGFSNAHSLQNKGVLNKLQEDNHVYYLEFKFPENRTSLPYLDFELKGTKLASTFYGFCKYHDEKYFTGIEDIPYENTYEQNFWFAFRAYSFEKHRKKRLKSSLVNMFKKYPHATLDDNILNQYRTNDLDLKDKEVEYERFKQIYENKKFNEIESFVKILPFKVGFTATTAIAIPVTIQGKKTVDIYDYSGNLFVPSVFISVIPKEAETLLIVSRFKEDLCYDDFLNDLKQNKDEELLFSYISFCLSEYSENIYFSPKLVKGLSLQEKNLITTSFLGVLSPTYDSRITSLLSSFQLNLFKYKI